MSDNFSNSLLFIGQVVSLVAVCLFALRMGKEALIGWLVLLTVSSNLFVIKQITLFGLNVTASDAIAVAGVLSLNLLQEYFGVKVARKVLWVLFFLSLSFIFLCQWNLWYIPNTFDWSQQHFIRLFSPMPRVIAASLFSFLIVQFLDVIFFNFLKAKMQGKHLMVRITLSLLLTQTLDTYIFTFAGLYGIVESISSVLMMSLIIKWMTILLTAPFINLSKKIASSHVSI